MTFGMNAYSDLNCRDRAGKSDLPSNRLLTLTVQHVRVAREG
jgi:hypothetical protein